MTREIFIVGNWKMYKTAKETDHFIDTLKPLVASVTPHVYIAVPFTTLETAINASKKTNIVIGAQNMNDATEGAFTGEIAGIMLKTAGAEFVILGHSERRKYFHETDEFIHKKVIRALKDDLQPILCVGETQEERENEKTKEVIEKQVKKGLSGISPEDIEKVIVAYEPVWAIGTGKTATPEMAQEVHAYIREILHGLFGKKAANMVSILYGGSVKPENIEILIAQEDIDGALVGGAALNPKTFAEIINKC